MLLKIAHIVSDTTNTKFVIRRRLLKSGNFCESILMDEFDDTRHLCNFLLFSYLGKENKLEYADRKNIISELLRIMAWKDQEWQNSDCLTDVDV